MMANGSQSNEQVQTLISAIGSQLHSCGQQGLHVWRRDCKWEAGQQ